jgi:hypothetical protein
MHDRPRQGEGGTLRGAGGVAALLAAVLAAGPLGCARPDSLAGEWDTSFAQPLHPAAELTRDAPLDPSTGRLRGDAGYALYLLTDAVGIEFFTPERFLATLHKHPRGGKNDHTIGHCWLILDGPRELIECGHTGEFGIVKPTYYQGVMRRAREGHDDPIGYLWETMPDGEFHRGPGTHRPTFVLGLPLTAERHRAIYDFLNNYDYKPFSLVSHACTDFVARAAELAGVRVMHQVRLNVPRETRYAGRTIHLRSSQKYATITVGSPDLMEAHLRRLARRGIGWDARAWYFE